MAVTLAYALWTLRQSTASQKEKAGKLWVYGLLSVLYTLYLNHEVQVYWTAPKWIISDTVILVSARRKAK